MSSGAWMVEPPPFDPDAPARPRRPGPNEPAVPFSVDDLDEIARRPPHLRTTNPWLCAFNLNAEDGIGHYSGMGYRQCAVKVADPTRSRYCLEHARRLGVDFYSPAETSEATDAETAGNLTRLVPKAVSTLETVMDDIDAPQGVRAKAADSVLDRTGYAKGIDVRMDARVAVVDVTSIIADRLDSLRDAQLAAQKPGDTASVTAIDGDRISGNARAPDPQPDPGAAEEPR